MRRRWQVPAPLQGGDRGRRGGKGALEQMGYWAALRRDSLGVGPWNVLPPEAGTAAGEY